MKALIAILSLMAINAAAIFTPQGAVTASAPIAIAYQAGTTHKTAALPPEPALLPEPAEAPTADDSFTNYGPYGEVWKVHTSRKEIALTFDDGPYPFYTPVLLHVLDRSHVPATFFLVGRSAQEFPELVTRIVESGNEIGNHTFNHYTLTALDPSQITSQIASDGALLSQFTGRPISLFRPPHGRFNHEVVAIAHELGYHTIMWSAAADDVKDIPPALIEERVLNEASPGGIILLHSGQFRTIEALPTIIDDLKAQGYSFVTVSHLIEDGEPIP